MSSTEVVIGVAGIIVALAAPIIALELQKWLDEKLSLIHIWVGIQR